MAQKIDFTVFCMESYKQEHGMTGKEALKVFKDYNVFEYIDSFYDVLHATGQEYIVEDIDIYIRSRQN